MNSIYLRVEEVGDGVGHVKQLRLEPAQQPALLPAQRRYRQGHHFIPVSSIQFN